MAAHLTGFADAKQIGRYRRDVLLCARVRAARCAVPLLTALAEQARR